jgi:hypothetical protein
MSNNHYCFSDLSRIARPGVSMSATPSIAPLPDDLPSVSGIVSYLGPGEGSVHVRVFPPSSGIATQRPPAVQHDVTIRDVRSAAMRLTLDQNGFEFHQSPTAFRNFYDETAVRARYYPEVEGEMRRLTGAMAVIVFDHNVRSAARAARGEPGVRVPVDQIHNDYTEESGPRRKQEILNAAGREDLMHRRVAFVNLWRPIVGPIQDNALALCDAQSVAPQDLVTTDIHHFGEDNLEVPRHRGQIYSVRHNAQHRWFYVSNMRPDDVLLLKCYDSCADGRARFMPHTGFQLPNCPPQFVPRESIEARTLVVFDEAL